MEFGSKMGIILLHEFRYAQESAEPSMRGQLSQQQAVCEPEPSAPEAESSSKVWRLVFFRLTMAGAQRLLRLTLWTVFFGEEGQKRTGFSPAASWFAALYCPCRNHFDRAPRLFWSIKPHPHHGSPTNAPIQRLNSTDDWATFKGIRARHRPVRNPRHCSRTNLCLGVPQPPGDVNLDSVVMA
jgi:hypothetical protein